MSEHTQRRFERVCVALDTVPSGTAALNVAAHLAQELEAELAGFFIEDENVLRAAALPFTRDVGFVSATARPMRLDEVQRALRVQAQALKSSLAATAEQLRLRWSFTTVVGTGVAPVLDISTELDLTVLAPRGAFPASRTVSPRAAHAHAGSAHRGIGVVCDGSEQALDALRLASAIARSRAAPLVLIVAADARASDLQRYVETIAAGEVPAVSCVRVEEFSSENMARAARDASTALLVVRFDAASSGDLAELLARTSCPLVLMR
jgi:nucleotide-binding universal stress UspA family protein